MATGAEALVLHRHSASVPPSFRRTVTTLVSTMSGRESPLWVAVAVVLLYFLLTSIILCIDAQSKMAILTIRVPTVALQRSSEIEIARSYISRATPAVQYAFMTSAGKLRPGVSVRSDAESGILIATVKE